MTKRPTGSNADEWQLFLKEYLADLSPRLNDFSYVAVQIAEAIEAAERRGRQPCGECHLKPGEVCDICGKRELSLNQEGREHPEFDNPRDPFASPGRIPPDYPAASEEQIAFWKKAANEAETKGAALTAFGVYAGLSMASRDTGTASCPICGKDTPHHHPSWEKNPAAWLCEIAHASSSKGHDPIVWFNWQPSLTFDKPDAPAGSIRNLRPLYHGQIVGTPTVTSADRP